MERRHVLKAALLLPAADLVGACRAERREPPSLEPSGARTATWAPRLLSPLQALVVEDAAERLIPETATPGARSAGVGAFIEGMLMDVYDGMQRKKFVHGIEALNREAHRLHDLDYPACSPEQQTALLAYSAEHGLQQAEPESKQRMSFLNALRELVIVGFCSSRLGATRVVGYEPVPGHYDGCGTKNATPHVAQSEAACCKQGAPALAPAQPR